MDPKGHLLKDAITGLSTDTTLHYVQNESFELNFMDFFAVSNMPNPEILEWKRPLRNHPSETQANRKQGITTYRSAIDARIQNRNPESNLVLQALLIDQYDYNNVDFNNANCNIDNNNPQPLSIVFLPGPNPPHRHSYDVMGFLDIGSTIMTPTVTRRHCAKNVWKTSSVTSGRNLKWFLLDFDLEERTKWTFRDVFRGWNFREKKWMRVHEKTFHTEHFYMTLHKHGYRNDVTLRSIEYSSLATSKPNHRYLEDYAETRTGFG
ncbi:hypothetical protein CAEBREN_00877 [Caenorhabditis brenneri]|uniref:Uncharacterized protein n=1 Tax=Caenorhabditis brenneri TaxID=135651 RepID=G0NC48_CAEBE|nr:hypothetical protein CAEBREN_00877 [Caenorhabditis brenneri]